MYRKPSAAAQTEDCCSRAHFSPAPGVCLAVLDTILKMVSIFVIPEISTLALGTAARLSHPMTTV